MESIRENILEIRQKIDEAAKASGRRGDDIAIVAATKTIDPDRINFAISQGIDHVGENRVQELMEKIDHIDKRAEVHFIGHLQTNKVKYILGRVGLIHSADSDKLLDEIEKRSAARGITSRVLIEINMSGEESKHGIDKNDIMPIIERNEQRERVKIEGLMTMGPLHATELEVRKVFEELNKLFLDIGAKKYNNSNMKFLSMGMSNDYVPAILEGANIVRLGRAIFGERIYYGGN